jgi:glutamate/tyrosine decarboxylase-like PLP-dependent enzyme
MGVPKSMGSREAVMAALEQFRVHDTDWRSGRTWGYVYDAGEAPEQVVKEAFSAYLSENGLDPTVFPSVMALENELVAIVADHLHAGPDAVGTFTSGGTESILLSVKTARDRFRALHPGAGRLELVLPDTAHAAFQKAAHYLDVVPVIVPTNPGTFRAVPEAMAQAVTERTFLLVGSAVSYAHGVVDPIEELGRIALERDVPLHVDGCIGGFLLPYFERLGEPVPPFDFRVPGVTSVSVDLHKYAFAAKGASLLIHRSQAYRRHQIYACSTWTGYTIVNTSVQSTKSGGPMAAAWAALHFIGDDGYLELARQMLAATRQILAGIAAIPGLEVLGSPDMNLVAFTTSDDTSVFHIADEMKERGWYVQPQLAYGHSKENLHLSVNPKGLRWAEAMLADLSDSVEAARKLPSGRLAATVKAAFDAMDPSDLTPEVFERMMSVVGVQGTALPGRMAEINELLNALSPGLRERLLVEYVNALYVKREAAR